MTMKVFAVFSNNVYHAFYQREENARRHWKNSRKYDVQYEIIPCTISVISKKKI